ncbi:MAG TPA: hypothetical protein VHE09_04450 [Rhizomicrobium sp.]|nr:hypothetical protein [Rhizomicrobium sp.]
MRTSRLLMAALTAGLLSSAALAAPPSAADVTVPHGTDMGQGHRQGRLKALFQSPEEFMMFRVQMREAMRGMPRDQRKAYKKSEFQRIRAMNDAEKASWRKDLDAKWAALPQERQQRMEAKLQRHEAKHEERQQRRHGQYQDQTMAQPQQ